VARTGIRARAAVFRTPAGCTEWRAACLRAIPLREPGNGARLTLSLRWVPQRVRDGESRHLSRRPRPPLLISHGADHRDGTRCAESGRAVSGDGL